MYGAKSAMRSSVKILLSVWYLDHCIGWLIYFSFFANFLIKIAMILKKNYIVLGNFYLKKFLYNDQKLQNIQ